MRLIRVGLDADFGRGLARTGFVVLMMEGASNVLLNLYCASQLSAGGAEAHVQSDVVIGGLMLMHGVRAGNVSQLIFSTWWFFVQAAFLAICLVGAAAFIKRSQFSITTPDVG